RTADASAAARRPALPFVEVVLLALPTPALDSHSLSKRPRRSLFGLERDYPARGISVQRRAGSPQHLGPIDVGKVDIGQLALPIGQGLGNPVQKDLEPSDAEVRPTAEPANRDPLVQ